MYGDMHSRVWSFAFPDAPRCCWSRGARRRCVTRDACGRTCQLAGAPLRVTATLALRSPPSVPDALPGRVRTSDAAVDVVSLTVLPTGGGRGGAARVALCDVIAAVSRSATDALRGRGDWRLPADVEVPVCVRARAGADMHSP